MKSVTTFLCQQYYKAFNMAEVILVSRCQDIKTSVKPFALSKMYVSKHDDTFMHVTYESDVIFYMAVLFYGPDNCKLILAN